MTTDTELIERIANKDKSAFERLYKSYHQRIFRFVLRMTKDNQLSEETVNDTLLAVWQSADGFQGNSAVSTWIFGIAYRQSLNALKRKIRHKRNTTTIDNISERTDENPYSDPEKMNELGEFTKTIKHGLNALSEGHRAVVQLTAMGYSYTEISEIIDCPANTVKTRMFHARKQLKHYVRQNDQLRNHKSGTLKSC